MHIHARRIQARHQHPLQAAARGQQSWVSRHLSPAASSGGVGAGVPGGWLRW
jgi:hypothetical protein